MLYSINLVLNLLLALPLGALAAETVHGVVVFSRHGDRTSKRFPPTLLTALGQNQLYNSGAFFRSRYIQSNSTSQIAGIKSQQADNSQLYASAPDQNLLVNSGQAFLQGLYPPFSDSSALGSTEILADSITTVAPPLSGYQYVVVHTIPDSDSSTIWLKGDDNCPKYDKAGADFYSSEMYMGLQTSTKNFYQSFSDITEGAFRSSELSYTNAYSIFDYINVNVIHDNSTAERITTAELQQLRTLADSHESRLNGNFPSVRSSGELFEALPISGRTLANKVLMQLSSIIDSTGKQNKFSLLLGSYDTFLSFFALSNLPIVSENFHGLPDYGSTLAFELISYSSDSTVGGAFPEDTQDLFVRFLFRNGTDNETPLVEYPLFGRARSVAVMPWTEFHEAMAEIAVSSVEKWCTVCDATGPLCPTVPESVATIIPDKEYNSHPLSPTVAGVVGAICALTAVGLATVLAMVLLGIRFSRPPKLTSEGVFKNKSTNGFHDGSSMDRESICPPEKVYAQQA